jgi:hypothetical protein
VQDWQSAFNYSKDVLGYSKIFLHGSSFGGGHVIVAGKALEGEHALAGIISQVWPCVDCSFEFAQILTGLAGDVAESAPIPAATYA